MESEQYQQPEAYPIQQQPIMAGHSTEGALRFQLEVEQELEILEHNLKGERAEYREGKVVWKVPDGFEPHINSVGALSLLATLRLSLSKIFTLSDLDQQQVENMTYTFGRTIKDNIFQNWDYYQVRDDTAASIILHTLTDAYFSNLSKAKNAKYLKFLSSTTSISEVGHLQQMQQRPQQDSEGILGRIFGGRKRR